jgi:hypothetical protein
MLQIEILRSPRSTELDVVGVETGRFSQFFLRQALG